MIRYRTVKKEATAETEFQRSRFIGYIAHAASREEAEDYVRRIRAEHRQATHCVPAYIVGEKMELMWTSDDGEPQGTSGPPILQMLEREGLTNVVCVVVRYYGGTKLGTGGLVRAYTQTAKEALEAAGIREVRERTILTVHVPYAILGKLQNLEGEQPFTIGEIVYGEDVKITLQFETRYLERIEGVLSDLNNGMPRVLERRDLLF